MVNFGPLAAEIGPVVWGTPGNFNGFHVLASLLQRLRSMKANQTLHDLWWSPGLLHYIYTFGSSCPVMEFCQGQNARYVPSLVFSYIGSITAWHSSNGRQPNFATLNRRRHLYLAGRPSRWALAHILVIIVSITGCCCCCYYFYYHCGGIADFMVTAATWSH